MIKDKSIHWFAVRVSYGRVLKFVDGLKDAGIEHFVPMACKKFTRNGKTETRTVPAISNLCFVRTTKAFLREYFLTSSDARNAHFMWDKLTRDPIVISDKAMEDFMQICRIMSDEVLYLKDITAKLQEGQKVRVINGPFKGVEGVILRIRRSRRVVVDFPGLLAVATSYVDPRDIEVI